MKTSKNANLKVSSIKLKGSKILNANDQNT